MRQFHVFWSMGQFSSHTLLFSVTEPVRKLVICTVTSHQAQILIQFYITLGKVDSFRRGKICNCLFGQIVMKWCGHLLHSGGWLLLDRSSADRKAVFWNLQTLSFNPVFQCRSYWDRPLFVTCSTLLELLLQVYLLTYIINISFLCHHPSNLQSGYLNFIRL